MGIKADISADLLKKYDRPGPRYTSYPTVPQWHTDFGSKEYRAALKRAAMHPREALALYVHIPFCAERCHYCGCNVVISKKPEIVEPFLAWLKEELSMVSAALGGRRRLIQLHWGGGTPTYLTAQEMELLFAHVTEFFDLDTDAEVAIEVDPRVTSREQIRTLQKLGFNRVSMGVQDLDPTVQHAIGRNQTQEETQQLIDWCRDSGFHGVNFDLIYGLPAQTLESWERTVRCVIDMNPDRLAVYGYAHLPKSIKHQAKMDAGRMPTPDLKLQLAALARQLLEDSGYIPIGMDHYARPNDELSIALRDGRLHRNFMGYTTIADSQVIGIGPSAISYVGNAYAQNEKRLFKYYRMIGNGDVPTCAGHVLTEDDLIRRWVIEQLMCNLRLSFKEMNNRFGIVFEDYFVREAGELEGLCADGFLDQSDEGLKITPLGQVFIRNIAMVFDVYLNKSDASIRYSRTV